MAFTCGFFNSENGDRKYNAEQMSAIFDGIIADGVFTTIGDHMVVSAGTGMQVLVGTGKAWFDHTWNVNDAAYPLTIAASDVTLSRIDAIVLETNHADSVRLNKLRVVQGTVASSPVKPTLTNSEDIHQHPLAWVTVAPGVTEIAASAIENAVGTSACPFVTGVIETTDIDDLFNQWNGEFDEWFDNLKAQLSDNVVANLQRQIDACVKIADKATSSDVQSGLNNNKWVTPKSLGESVLKIGDIKASGRDLETETDGRLLQCDGRRLYATDYPELFDAIGYNFGESGRNFSEYISDGYNKNSNSGFSYILSYAIDDNGDILTIHYRYGHITVAVWTDKNGTIKSTWTVNTLGEIGCYCRFVNHQPLIVYAYGYYIYIAYGSAATAQETRLTYRPSEAYISQVDGNYVYIWVIQQYNNSVLLKYDFVNKTIGTMSIADNTGGDDLDVRLSSSNFVRLGYLIYIIYRSGVSDTSAVLDMRTGVLSTLPTSNIIHEIFHTLTSEVDGTYVRRDDYTVYIPMKTLGVGYFIEKVDSDITVIKTLYMLGDMFITPKKILSWPNSTLVTSSGEATFNILNIEQGVIIDSVYQLPNWITGNGLAYLKYKGDGVTLGRSDTFFIPTYDTPVNNTSHILNYYGISDGTFALPKEGSALTQNNCLYIKALMD